MFAMIYLAGATGHADPVEPILLALVFLTLGAMIGGRLMTLMKQPAVLGELLVGMIAGNLGYYLGNAGLTVLREGDNLRKISDLALTTTMTVTQAVYQVLPLADAGRVAAALSGANSLDYLAIFSFVDFLARIAILILLFLVGLETSLGEMRRVGKSALLVAVIGVIVPMALGMGTMKLLHPESELARDLFIGGILTATSVGITARVLRDLGQETRDESRVILGAAVIDDVLSLIVLAVVSGLAVTGTVRPASIAMTTFVAALFLAGSLGIGIWITPRIVRKLATAGIRNLKLLFGLGFAFLLSWLANVAGLATIVGAFAAGMILNDFFDKELEGQSLHELISPVESLVVPLFFVWMGIQVKLESLSSRDVLIAGLLLTVVAILGKLVSGWGCPRTMNRWAVGFGMMPRGEVGLIFAGIGRGIGVVDDGLFSAVVILVMITTLLAPVMLRVTLGSQPAASA
ncbi:MAG TPA: cation:proton antiporter [Terriglobales bacterium]|nr:cation:proton antiporter [Terriglobales bacterium]